MKTITLDGYEYTLIFKQPTSMNTLCVYEIQQVVQETNEPPVYFLASNELREHFITWNTFNQLKSYIMPQHFEGFFVDKFTAILMAKNIAMDCYIKSQKAALENAQKVLEDVSKIFVKCQSEISWDNCDEYMKYYDAQDALREEAEDRENEMRKDENK